MKKIIATTVSISLALSGCATSTQNLAASYVSPVQYNGYDCEQLIRENQRITQRVSQLAGRLDEAASNDKALVGVGMLLFWPALFALGGTKEQEAEYSRLKGEHDAILETINLKKCASPSQTANGAEAASPAITAQ